jgi:hypothetical protein
VIYREDNTEGYSASALAELNRRWAERHADLDPDGQEGKVAAELLLAEFDAEIDRGGAL